MIMSSGRGEAHEVMEMQQKANLQRYAVKSKSASSPNWHDQKQLCYNCPLFTEHQEYKFRHFNWLSLPITISIIALAFHLYESGYSFTVTEINKMLNNNVNLPDNAAGIHGAFEWIVLFIITLLLWTFIVSLIDRMFNKWNL